jgi:hypothetical protein
VQILKKEGDGEKAECEEILMISSRPRGPMTPQNSKKPEDFLPSFNPAILDQSKAKKF